MDIYIHVTLTLSATIDKEEHILQLFFELFWILCQTFALSALSATVLYCVLCTSIALSVRMENNLKLVDYSDSESEPEESQTLPVTQHGTSSAPVRDSQGRQVAVVGPTPQSVAVVHPMEGDGDGDEEDLEGTGIFEVNEDDPLSALSTQATQGSSPNIVDPYFVSQEIAESLDLEIPRGNEDVIVISDSSQGTIIVSEPGDLDDHRSATSGNYSLLNIFPFQIF